jgi:ferrochelatase
VTQVVLLGFGGPRSQSDVRPFLDRILEGRRTAPERYEEVVQHYEVIGGRSPFIELTERQAAGLRAELSRRGVEVPVRAAYRFSEPFIADVAAESAGVDTIGIILAVLQSEASWQAYTGLFPAARFTPPFSQREGVIAANAERASEALRGLGNANFATTKLIFTAHSIPLSMAARGPYVEQFEGLARSVATLCEAADWQVAYQSRSGAPDDPWLEPDVRDVLRALPETGVRDAVVVPAGFLCDHVEVLYDLDVDAANVARESGVRMARAAALNDHPLFLSVLADLVQECLAR